MSKRKTYLIKPLLGLDYPEVTHGKGIYLYDTEGNEYIDAASGAATANIGHSVMDIAKAMYEQAARVSFAYRSHFTSEPAEKLAEMLANYAQGDLNWVFFVNSGSEATETALKIALQYWQERGKPEKNHILSRWMSYHGITLGALSMSGHIIRRRRFESLLKDYPAIPPPYCYRCPYNLSYPQCKTACASELEQAIIKVGADKVAAFIFEPVIGAAGGAVVPPDHYYKEIKTICDKYDILLIADEVMTGIGRTGKMFAMEHWNVQPDLIALGKGMSAGYTPMAATIVSDRIIEVIEQGSKVILSGHTFSGNPQSASICTAVLEYIKKHNLVQNAKEQGERLLMGLANLEKKYPLIGHYRGLGLLCGLEFVRNKETKEPFPFDLEITNRIIQYAFQKGLILYPAAGGINGNSGDAILIAPPLTINRGEIYKILTILEEVINEISLELENEGLLTNRSIY
jgi:adenosylmethionine-8-amino-7-oxononanoate aminotransferase